MKRVRAKLEVGAWNLKKYMNINTQQFKCTQRVTSAVLSPQTEEEKKL